MELYVIRDAPAETAFDPYGRREVPVPAGLQLYRGAVFSYYEFARPADAQRLDDEGWRRLLDKNGCPGFPPWSADFLQPIRAPIAERLRAGEAFSSSDPRIRGNADPGLKEAALEGYLLARKRGTKWAGWEHLSIYLDRVDARDAPRLIELAEEAEENTHLRQIANTFATAATPADRRALLEKTPAGHPNLAVLAMMLIDEEQLSVEELKRALGRSEMGRWALAVVLGWRLPEQEEAFEGATPDKPPDAADLEELAKLALADPSYLVRAQAMHALSEAPREHAVPILRRGLADESPAVRTLAALGLLGHGDRASLALILRLPGYLVDPENRERARREGEAFHRRTELLSTGALLWNPYGRGYLLSTLLDSLATHAPEAVARFRDAGNR
jgi:hypothetical protein